VPLARIDAWILNWPPTVILLAFVALGTATGVCVHFVLAWVTDLPWCRKYLHHEHHEIASHFVGVVGLIYGILIGLVVVTAWQERDDGARLTLAEQHSVDDLFHVMLAFRGQPATNIRWLLLNYTTIMGGEWVAMRAGEPLCLDITQDASTCPAHVVDANGNTTVYAVSQVANNDTECVRDNLAKFAPASLQQLALYQEALRLSADLSENRVERHRRYARSTLQGILWGSFFLGALILAAMTYFVAGQDRRSQLVRTTALFAMVGMMWALAFVFDHPFMGSLQISGQNWQTMAEHFSRDLGDPETAPPSVSCPNQT
jgi:uncharacterized membrane protein YraQ (UPF0718 family)